MTYAIKCEGGVSRVTYESYDEARAAATRLDSYSRCAPHTVVRINTDQAASAADNRKDSTMITVTIPGYLADRYVEKASNPAKLDKWGNTLRGRILDAERSVTVTLTEAEAAHFLADCNKPYPKDADTGKSVRDYVADAVLGK
jgi:hypothetical protein